MDLSLRWSLQNSFHVFSCNEKEAPSIPSRIPMSKSPRLPKQYYERLYHGHSLIKSRMRSPYEAGALAAKAHTFSIMCPPKTTTTARKPVAQINASLYIHLHVLPGFCDVPSLLLGGKLKTKGSEHMCGGLASCHTYRVGGAVVTTQTPAIYAFQQITRLGKCTPTKINSVVVNESCSGVHEMYYNRDKWVGNRNDRSYVIFSTAWHYKTTTTCCVLPLNVHLPPISPRYRITLLCGDRGSLQRFISTKATFYIPCLPWRSGATKTSARIRHVSL